MLMALGDPERTRDIQELSAPKSIKKVQSVLGVFNYVRHFIPNFSTLAKFLTSKLSPAPYLSLPRKRVSDTGQHSTSASKFVWSDQDQADFDALKHRVLEAPLLAILDYSKPIYVRCDASRFGCGAVLFQYDEHGREHVACYASRKFSSFRNKMEHVSTRSFHGRLGARTISRVYSRLSRDC